jgi:hypothetical protein
LETTSKRSSRKEFPKREKEIPLKNCKAKMLIAVSYN